KITSLEQGPDGALYYTKFSTGAKIRRIRYIGSGGNHPPVITDASANPVSGADPLPVTFNGAATDNENDPLTYHWLFGDGNEADGASVSHTYNGNGSYNAVLQVSDGTTTVASNPIQIDVGSPPGITSITPDDGTIFRAGNTVEFSATATDSDETLDESSFSWEILFHHNDHFHTGPTHSGSNGSLFIETSGHDWNDNTRYEIIVDVTDSDGLSDTASVFIYPDKIDLTLETVPNGLTIYLDSIPKIAPIVYDTLIDFQHNIGVAAAQCLGTTEYTFDSWSDGGAANHDVIVPDSNTTLQAMYIAGGACSGGGDPGVVTPISPSGNITENTPAFIWNADPNATRYKLRVDDSSGIRKVNTWYTAEAAGCGTGTGTCSIVTGYTLKEGDGAWKVKAANDSIKAAWSAEMTFTVDTGGGGGGDPGVVTLVSPGGGITDRTPAYTWDADPNATKYKLRVDDSSGTRKVNTWYTADAVGCGSGTGTCSIAPSYQLAFGDGAWKVRAANDSVKTAWSAEMTFTVEGGGGGVPGTVTLVSPSGNISDRRPDYTWNADPAATRYKLKVNDSTGSNKVLTWYTADEAGCGAATGTCFIDPGYSLADGDGSWQVKAGTDADKGPWSPYVIHGQLTRFLT
ncbi:MAG: PKD domain-containing protein, partial [Pseudomonadota bacterium]|nr:PKD domain-containing protein [Pseudomonadota bacterium]